MKYLRKLAPFFSIVISIYFGALFPTLVIQHQKEHLKEYNSFVTQGSDFHSKKYSGKEINDVHNFQFDLQCNICKTLEKKKKFIKSSNVNIALTSYPEDLKNLTSRPFFQSILFKIAPPLRGPPLA